MAQNFNIGDMQALTAAGGMQQAQNQSVLDAVRQTTWPVKRSLINNMASYLTSMRVHQALLQ
jgi:hypothetical protein